MLYFGYMHYAAILLGPLSRYQSGNLSANWQFIAENDDLNSSSYSQRVNVTDILRC